jgi:hypothetical protein
MTDHHIHDNGEHVAHIERRLRALADSFDDAASSDDFDELFKIIHFPGWTTPVEIEFMHSLIDATERSVAGAVALRTALVSGARAVAEGSAVAGTAGS